jgi:hypothetical protein
VNPLPTWRNAHADIDATSHPTTVRMYLEQVVTPALLTLDRRIATLDTSDEPGAVFEKADTEAVKEATLQAFCLSIQSLWERQLRGYLVSCATEFGRGDLVKKIERATWIDLQSYFRELRAHALSAFASFPELDLLRTVGNVCRHGDGAAARKLHADHPEFWPPKSEGLEVFGLDAHIDDEPRADALLVSAETLANFVSAIIAFWDDAEFIYINSLTSKHSSVLRRLQDEEAAFRARWRGA